MNEAEVALINNRVTHIIESNWDMQDMPEGRHYVIEKYNGTIKAIGNRPMIEQYVLNVLTVASLIYLAIAWLLYIYKFGSDWWLGLCLIFTYVVMKRLMLENDLIIDNSKISVAWDLHLKV